jgi:hypothetical protein
MLFALQCVCIGRGEAIFGTSTTARTHRVLSQFFFLSPNIQASLHAK